MRAALSLLLAALLTMTGAPLAEAHSRWQTVTAASTQEGCHLTVTATYRTDRRGIVLDSVLAEGLNGWRVALGVMAADGRTVYAGPVGHGRVGDGIDYLWTAGWERNSDGAKVRIGASDLNPRGWPSSGYTAKGGFTLTVSAPEYRYCGVTLEVR